jgi:predicted PurR-regulated permease PerM
MPIWSTFYARVFTLVVVALLGYALFLLFMPLFDQISWAVVLAFLLYPLNTWLRRRLRSADRAAGLLTLLTPLVILLPLSALSVTFVAEASQLLQQLQGQVRRLDIKSFADLQQLPSIARADSWLQEHTGVSAGQVQNWVLSGAQELLHRAAGFGSSAFLGALGSLVGFFLMISLLFFFLRDGDVMLSRARLLIPLDEERKERLFGRLSDVVRAIVFGTAVTAIAQGALLGVGFAIADLPSPVVFAVLATLLSLLPVGGAAIVWIPAVGWLLYDGRWGYAIFLLAWGAMLSGADNVMRPMLISGRAKISALAVFVGALGGIPAFGAIGLIVGPLVLSLVLALVEFAEEVPGAGPRA